MRSAAQTYRFGPFVLDRGSYRLTRDGAPIALAPKVIDLLFLFASQPGELVTKDGILQALWPDVAVTDNAITQVVSDLRQALADDPAAPKYVQTVPRRGYRFIAAVEAVTPASSRAVSPAAEPAPAAPRARAIAVLEFANVTSDAEFAWLATGLAETVTNDLRAIGDLRVIDRVLIPPAHESAAPLPAEPAGPQDGAAALGRAGVDLVVVGSFQRAGSRLRITARVIEVATSEALVHAKADGELTDVFGLQDAIVRQLVAGLRLNVTPAAAARLRARETSSLEAYRALTEGRLRLEALDPALIPDAIAAFERALSLDPRYALAHIGLAHAHFWRFQGSRARVTPDVGELETAIRHVQQAIAIDPELAEAHAALAFFLSSGDRPVDAVAAGRRAVALEPGNWRHLFRLGIAVWGEERLSCLGSVVAQFPRLAYAHMGMAMVHVARGFLVEAEETLRQGLSSMDAPASGSERFPASGLHWLVGLVRLAVGDPAGAQAAFERELHSKGSRLFAEEYAMAACDGLGYLRLSSGDPAGAIQMFTRALERVPDHARSLTALAAAYQAAGMPDQARETSARAQRVIDQLRKANRLSDAALATASLEVAAGRHGHAASTLRQMLNDAVPGPAGWTIPIEPWLTPLRGQSEFHRVLRLLAERAS
jgi:DNA-binding winged helix-turn-helix (wHTH) protein/Tfp pilus assembly protein PilF